MFGLTFLAKTDIKGIQTEEFEGGRRFRQGRDFGFTFGKLFGVLFGLFWIGLGIAMPFLSETAAPGMSLFLKAAIGIFMTLFGAFIISAVCRNLAGVLEVDLARRSIRSFTIDRNNKPHALREIAFQDVRGVFTEGESTDDDRAVYRESLIITYKRRPGRLTALTANSDQIAIVRDYILTAALQQQAAPVIDGWGGFVERAKWELQQRVK